MKRLLSFIISILIIFNLFSITSYGAESSTESMLSTDDFDITYVVENNEARITKVKKKIYTITVPDTIDGYPVTSIDSSAFYKSYGTIIIPEGITSIGNFAFAYGSNLFVYFPDSLTNMGERLFYDSEINYVGLSPKLTHLPKSTFAWCILRNINLPPALKSIGPYAFTCSWLENITLPSGLESIGEGAFSDTSIKQLTIPTSVKNMGVGVFEDCEHLASVYIPPNPGITEINNKTFEGCTSLKSINIPEGITRIGAYAFKSTAVERFDLPQSLVSIGSEAFKGKNSIIQVPDSVTTIESNAFDQGDTILAERGTFAHNYALKNNIKFVATDTVKIALSPKKTTYIEGETFNKEDLVVTAFFEDGTSEEVEYYEIDGFESTVGKKTITVSYYNYSLTYEIDVVEKQVIDLKVEQKDDVYYERDPFGRSSFIVTAYYDNGKSEEIYNYIVIDFDTSSAGTKTGVFEYGGYQTSFSFNVQHKWKDFVIEYKDCKSEGIKTLYCQYCDAEKKEIAPPGHTIVIDKAVAPTCEKTGYTEGKHCSLCGEVIIARKIIPATAHSYKNHILKSPTCTEDGQRKYTCRDCGYSYTNTIPKINHTEVTVKGKDATCTETGLTESKYCIQCNQVLKTQEVIPAKGHYKIIDKGYYATCTRTGLTDGKHCSRCEEVLVAQEVIPASGHKIVIDQAVPPTCTDAGLSEGKHCFICNEIFVAQMPLKTKGHTIKTTGKKSATYFNKGYSGDETCVRCNTIFYKGKVTAKLKLKAPKIAVKTQKKKITVKYKKVKGATGFEVKCKRGSTTIIKTYSTKKDTNKIIKNLEKGTYKIYARTFVKQGNKKTYSSWTKAKKVKVK